VRDRRSKYYFQIAVQKRSESGEDYIMSSFMMYAQIKNEMGGVCGTYGIHERCEEDMVEDHFGNLNEVGE
jgi:hypothetical protein